MRMMRTRALAPDQLTRAPSPSISLCVTLDEIPSLSVPPGTQLCRGDAKRSFLGGRSDDTGGRALSRTVSHYFCR